MHDKIRELRKNRGLTQEQIAEHLKVDRSTYAYYESGRTRLNIDVVVKLAHFFQVSYATIIGQPEPVLSNSTGTAVPSD
jgi:transcriptional regulator with XRE-family HTH domain